ncbi:MAG: ABC transporter permease, partial [Gammaproteobacteria bacterium]|nr:ABC transporter permease [Gammaproteobacteria bacterium]
MKLIYKWLIFAWKNIWRNRRRSLTTLGISAIGITGILFFGGFALYTYQSLEEFSARQQGHVLLAQHDYFDKEETTPLALGLSDWQDKQSLLKNIQGVRRVLPRTSFSGLISNGDKSTIFIGDGVDAKHEFTVTGPFMEVTHGDILSPNDGDMPQVMLATGLAKNLNATIGSSLTLLSTTTDGALNGVDVTVVGIFSTGVPEMDKRKLFVSLATTQSLLNSTKVSLLAVYLKNTQDTHIVETKIKQLFAELSTRNWFDLAFFYHKVRDLYDRIFSVVGLVILIVVL